MKSLKVITLLLILLSAAAAQTKSKTDESKIFIRYETPVGEYRIGEDLTGLTETKNTKFLAIRVCSNKDFPEAFLKAAADPFLIAEKLTGDFGIPPEKIHFLLSKDCTTIEEKEAVEIWLISNKSDYPPNIKNFDSTQVDLTSMGKSTSNRGMSDYKNAYKKLLIELRTNANSVGVIKGYYLKEPSRLLEKRLKEIETFLKNNNFAKDRYKILREPLLDEISTYPKDKEPEYPQISLLKISSNIDY